MDFIEFEHSVCDEYAKGDKEHDEDVRHYETDLGKSVVYCVVSQLQECEEDGIDHEDVTPFHYDAVSKFIVQ